MTILRELLVERLARKADLASCTQDLTNIDVQIKTELISKSAYEFLLVDYNQLYAKGTYDEI